LLDDDESIVSNKSSGELPPMRGMRFRRAVLPNILKIVQGLLVLFTSLVVIIQSYDLIELLKDFTALFFVSEIDNIVFRMTEQRFFGNDLKERSDRVKKVLVEDKAVIVGANACCRGINFRFMILFSLFATMVSIWGNVIQGQVSGKFFGEKYPFCSIERISIISEFGDGFCDRFFNTNVCGFDGGDCLEFNAEYPDCIVPYPWYIGDGYCNGAEYNVEACGWDGGDCFRTNYPDCIGVDNPSNIGNGDCDNVAPYNTEACGWDGGDCLLPDYPDCIGVDNPSNIGNGDCDNVAPYNTEACGWDGGDCLHPDYPDCKGANPYFIGDGNCDDLARYNNAECGWDGGDCLPP
jgi:hypothetical protein